MFTLNQRKIYSKSLERRTYLLIFNGLMMAFVKIILDIV